MDVVIGNSDANCFERDIRSIETGRDQQLSDNRTTRSDFLQFNDNRDLHDVNEKNDHNRILKSENMEIL